MGIVYEAEQISLGRRVALKVLPFAATLDPRQLQRFHNEARTAAGLHHTNIVPVYAVGCERGVHYYAMQFLEARTLADLIAQQRGGPPSQIPTMAEAQGAAASAPTVPPAAEATSSAPRDAAYFRRVAEWGIQAAEALDYAHALGVVHRDVKPANLLVDGHGRLWVTDFGLAQVQRDPRLTQTGDLVGTLRYMSPEQALAKRVVIDHRTDVYSLGATLYELLALRPAFDGSDRQEMLRRIAFDEPRRLCRIVKAVPAELETVVLKAMEKRLQDRYRTAQDLADDLRRWREDRPIQARRPSLGQVAARWGRRHRPAVGAAAAVLLIVALLGGGTARWWAQKRAGAEGEARTALREAAGLQLEERWPEALGAVRRAEGVLAGVGAAPGLRQQVEDLGRDLEMARRLQEARLQLAGQKDGHFHEEAASASYAEAFAWYGLDVDHLDVLEAAERIRSRPIAAQLAVALDDWAWLRLQSGTGGWPRLVAIARAADPDEWRDRLRDALERSDPKALEGLAAAGPSDELRPATAVLLARLSRGTPAADRVVACLRQVRRRHPADFWVNFELGYCLSQLRPPRLGEALHYYTAAVALRPQSPGAHLNLGAALKDNGQLDEAIAEYREALRLMPGYALAYNNLGAALYAKGRLDEAITAYQEALLLKRDDAEAHDDDEAIAVYREALHLKPDFAVAHNNLGAALKAKGQLDEAIAAYREAIRFKPDYAEAHCNLGQVLLRKGQVKEAVEELRCGHKLGSRNPSRWPYPSAQWLDAAERLMQAKERLPSVLQGKDQPKDARERIAFAQLCQEFRERHAASVHYYEEAFTAEPKLAENPTTGHRYNAACAAARAGTGKGKELAVLDAKDRARLRKQGLDWLRSDLAAWRRLLDEDPAKARPVIVQTMRFWLADTDFAGVRGPEALANLPEAEREAWRQLWADVADALALAEKQTTSEKQSDK
jgi:tetratricopeptide (TPR) repeat protein